MCVEQVSFMLYSPMSYCKGTRAEPNNYEHIDILTCTLGAIANILCVVAPLHEWATGSLPKAGRPPNRQEGPSEVHFLCCPHGD